MVIKNEKANWSANQSAEYENKFQNDYTIKISPVKSTFAIFARTWQKER